MTRLTTATVSLAVTPTVIRTFFSHYLNRRTLHQKPTAHLSYDEGLNLIRAFLEFASHHTVEDLQAFTAQWVPHPQWVKVKEVDIPDSNSARAADLIKEQLGEDGIRKVGGTKWWQWRNPDAPLRAEWIEMRSDYNERKKGDGPGNRVMLYVHGGAYFFGSVDEHRYQMQRHARKLKARVFAPEYRLAPQFPFPCGLQDCVAAYLFLLETMDSSAIVLAGDSAGAGMVMSLMVVLRDRGVPLPAGAVLISPWVDLTHSFPSVAGGSDMDYIPPAGFHQKPSMAWPPPNNQEMDAIREKAEAIREKLAKVAEKKGEPVSRAAVVGGVPGEMDVETDEKSRRQSQALARMLTVEVDGRTVELTDQIQMYTTNELLSHPLVSPVLQPTLGGLPPLLIMVGGAEVLRDEQIFLAHKCANPAKYAPDDLSEEARAQLAKYGSTPVQLQVWDDLCHVAPTLSFTRPAKHMYRSIAQFSAWALARAQNTSILIPDDDDVSILSSSPSVSEMAAEEVAVRSAVKDNRDSPADSEDPPPPPGTGVVGKAGDPLPPFRNHMVRQRVTRHGTILPLDPESHLAGCMLKPGDVGVVKAGPVRNWLETRGRWDAKYARAKAKAHERLAREMAEGYIDFGDGETPPPSALAGRRRSDEAVSGWRRKRTKNSGMALWSLWGSEHDKMIIARGDKATATRERDPSRGKAGDNASLAEESGTDGGVLLRGVTDENQIGEEADTSSSGVADVASQVDETVPGSPQRRGTIVEDLLVERKEKEEENKRLLGPEWAGTGVAGRRPTVNGIAVPFSLGVGTATSSMVTLNSDAPGTPPVVEDWWKEAVGPDGEVPGLQTKAGGSTVGVDA
ncbi:related to acetyl-hydrolase [Cephalotrichum gorgonifer]|uniref:Related to acetyl-hydrolase n=1 Tax=Cephalotrichum gorgonifer TaxID=2041049 RepID=A0AAE8N4V0_9PEZI|nr:related to acetyl-hydrolase [Cephalotrichum gorgonifer]